MVNSYSIAIIDDIAAAISSRGHGQSAADAKEIFIVDLHHCTRTIASRVWITGELSLVSLPTETRNIVYNSSKNTKPLLRFPESCEISNPFARL